MSDTYLEVKVSKDLLRKSSDPQIRSVIDAIYRDALKAAKEQIEEEDKYGKSVLAPTPNSQGYSMPHYPGYAQWDLSEGEAVDDATSNKPCNHNYIFIGNSIGWVCKHCDEEQP